MIPTRPDVLEVDVHMIISVRPHVLMMEAERMKELMNDRAMRKASSSKTHLLLSPERTNIGRTTGMILRL